MKIDEHLAAARLDLPTLARLSGVSLYYLKHLSSGRRPASDDARRKVSAALREHAAELIQIARGMEAGLS